MPDDDREFFHALADIFGEILNKDESERLLPHEAADRCAEASDDDPSLADTNAELLAGVEEVEAARRRIHEGE